MAEELAEFRLEIDGQWSSRDMCRIMESVTFFHDAFYLASCLYRVNKNGDGAKFREIVSALSQTRIPASLVAEFAGPGIELQVMRIEYGSPGFEDFLGVGKSVREFLRFCRDLIKIPQEIEKQKLENEQRAEMIRKQKIANLGSLLKVLKENGVGEDDRKAILETMMRQQNILSVLVSERKLISVQSAEVKKAA